MGARQALILLAAQTGARVSELAGLPADDVHLGAGSHVRCTGKGRKQRCTPLTAQTASHLARPTAARRPSSTSTSAPTGAVL
jgi:integrase/recombinase XerD